jgi:hypothetical protein
MSTSYADSAQAREWDRRFDAYGRPRQVSADFFHDYEAAAARNSEREAIRLAERKAAQVRINAAVGQIGDFFGLNGNVSNSPLHGTFNVQGVNMNATTELATVPPKETALAVYSAPNGLEPWLQKIRDEVLSFVPDTSTAKGRAAIASIAHKVAKSKVALDDAGKKLVAELKEVPKLIDAERKRMRETLEALQDQVRRPLNEWEEKEAARVAAHKAVIAHIENTDTAGMSAALIGAKVQDLDSLEINQELEEFEADAHRAKAASLVVLRKALADQEQYEAEQAELARLRAEAEVREQKEREDRIAREAAEKARIEAEQKAQREREAEAQRVKDEQAAAAKRESDLKLQVEQAERDKAKAEADRIWAEEQAEQAKHQAEKRASIAASEARAAEKKRADDAAAEIIRQQQEREADKAHKSKIMGEAKLAIMSMNVTEELAKALVLKIYRGEVPNISINF